MPYCPMHQWGSSLSRGLVLNQFVLTQVSLGLAHYRFREAWTSAGPEPAAGAGSRRLRNTVENSRAAPPAMRRDARSTNLGEVGGAARGVG